MAAITVPPSPLPPAGRSLSWLASLAVAPAAVLAGPRLAHGAWPSGPGLLPALVALPTGILLALSFSGALGLRNDPLARRRQLGALLRAAAAPALATLLAGLAAHVCGVAGWDDGWGALLAGTTAAAWLLAAGLHGLVWLGSRHQPRCCVLVGPTDCRQRLREHLAAHPEAGLVVVGEIGPEQDPVSPLPWFPMSDLAATVSRLAVDEVLLSTGFDDRLLMLETMTRLLQLPLVMRYVPDPEALPLFCPQPSDLAGLPAIDLSRGPLSPGAELAKWIEDKTVACVAIAILGLPMLLIAAAIKLTSPGPVLFVQERHGQYGRPIKVFKFRTMRADLCTQDVTTGRFKQAEKGDARITRFGRFLRNTSLDEIPQFLNVLSGGMSVVGPRPHPIALNKRFASDIGDMMRRHYVKPGITGLAQINGARGETRTAEDMRRRVLFDLEYLRHWSLWLDLKIIVRTALAGWINRQS